MDQLQVVAAGGWWCVVLQWGEQQREVLLARLRRGFKIGAESADVPWLLAFITDVLASGFVKVHGLAKASVCSARAGPPILSRRWSGGGLSGSLLTRRVPLSWARGGW